MSSGAWDRKKRAKRIGASELYTVVSEKGGYLKVCARWCKHGRMVRIGTFARLPLDAKPSNDEMRVLVMVSVESGKVLKIDEAQQLLLADAMDRLTGNGLYEIPF